MQNFCKKDPEYGAKLHVSDHYRIGRAIELIRSQGKTVTEIQNEFAKTQTPFPFPLLKIGPSWERGNLKRTHSSTDSKDVAKRDWWGRFKVSSTKVWRNGQIDEQCRL